MTLAELIKDGYFSRDPALVWAARALSALRTAQEHFATDMEFFKAKEAVDEVLRATEEEV